MPRWTLRAFGWFGLLMLKQHPTLHLPLRFSSKQSLLGCMACVRGKEGACNSTATRFFDPHPDGPL